LARVPEIAKILGSKLEIQVLASPPGAKHEPVPAALERELTNVDASQRASILAQAMQKSIADCKPARDLFQSLAAEPASGKGSSFKEKLPVAVAACDCKVGADLTDLAAYLLGGDRIAVGKRLVSSAPRRSASRA
jgi:hypothetical protein